MFTCHQSSENNNFPQKPKNSIHKNLFHFNFIIGKGGFGKVWKVEYTKTKETFALKEMAKLKIIDKKSEKSINSERKYLTVLNHPFIVNMHYAFQDNDNLYLVLDFLSGGDLRYHVSRYRRFSEEQTRFFIASIIYALDYIHKNNVIHRDIKPENLVLDDMGYVRITDFGIAKDNSDDNTNETSGTPGYMAPEVMRGKNHSFAVDFFAIGVIGYEFMKGKRPYYGQNKKEIKEQMLSTQAVIEADSMLQLGWSPESVDFINQLLLRKVDRRLGRKNGAKDLMEHPWLKYYPWEQLGNKTLLSPFIPETKDNFDKKYCESIEKITEETKHRYAEIIKKNKLISKPFLHYYYNKEDTITQAIVLKKHNKDKDEVKKIEIHRDRDGLNHNASTDKLIMRNKNNSQDNSNYSNCNNSHSNRNSFNQSDLLQTFLPISINKGSSSKLILLNKNSLNSSRNIYESNNNVNKSNNNNISKSITSNIHNLSQCPIPNPIMQNNETKAIKNLIPSNIQDNDNDNDNDLNNDSVYAKDKNEINLIQKRLTKVTTKNHNSKMNQSHSINQYNNIIVNRILNNNNFYNSSQLVNKSLNYKNPLSNRKVSLIKNHSRSSSIKEQKNNDSWRNTSLFSQIEHLSQNPNNSTRNLKGILDFTSKLIKSKVNRENKSVAKKQNKSYYSNISSLRRSYESISPYFRLKYS